MTDDEQQMTRYISALKREIERRDEYIACLEKRLIEDFSREVKFVNTLVAAAFVTVLALVTAMLWGN